METSLERKNTAIAKIDDYIMVNLDGKVLFNIQGILDSISSGKLFEYEDLSEGRNTFMSGRKIHTYLDNTKKIRKTPLWALSWLAHGIEEMISHATEVKPGWFENTWNNDKVYDGYQGIQDILFYDEFLFLIQEDLIEIEDFVLLTEDDIHNNFMAYCEQKDSPEEFAPMYNSKTIKELRKAWAKLVTQYHPDKVGDNEMAKKISQVYYTLNRKMKNEKNRI